MPRPARRDYPTLTPSIPGCVRPAQRIPVRIAIDQVPVDASISTDLARDPFVQTGVLALMGALTSRAMEQKGLVARHRDAGDAWAVMLHVTAAGRRLTERLLPIAERYEAVALVGFSAAETKTLKAALRRLYVNMDALEQ
jgi:hypothetical protein